MIPLDKATDKQLEAVRRCVMFKAGLKPYHRHDDNEIVENLNDLLHENITSLDELTNRQASNFIKQLTQV